MNISNFLLSYRVIVIGIFSFCFFGLDTLQSQTNTRESGDYRSCFTWQDQSRVGEEEARIQSGHTVDVNANHRSFNAIQLASNSSVLQFSGSNAVDISTSRGNTNMNTCRTVYEETAYSSSACVSLWSQAEAPFATWTNFFNTMRISLRRLILAKIEKAGNYRLNSLNLVVTIPWRGDAPSDGCWGTNFHVKAIVQKHGINLSPNKEYTICNWCGSLGTMSLSSCGISGAPNANPTTEFSRNNAGNVNIDLGYCNVGDEISLLYQTEGNINKCAAGGMRGFAQYRISMY